MRVRSVDIFRREPRRIRDTGGDPMNTLAVAVARPKTWFPVLIGGFAAGAFDLTSAFIDFGWGVPRAVASGLLGAAAFRGGVGTWILGVVLHFVIAFSAAAIYYLASWRLSFLKEHYVLCGVFYGIGVYLVMNLVVLPLSAVPWKIGPFAFAALVKGILVHMFLIGLPISFSVAKFSK
jgi:hypothetical protein